MRSQWIVTAIVATCALTACSRQETGWRDAAGEDTIAAYQAYLQDFPASAHAGKARARLLELQQEDAWAKANRLRTPEAWQRYLGDWPEGRHAPAARRLLAQFVPGDAAAASDAFAVQLGAYSTEQAARAGRESLARNHPAELASVQWRILAPRNPATEYWRLRVGPFAEAPARDLCNRLKARGVDCVPVAGWSAGQAPP
ncbi:MAG: SPOR domain-containing protein [Steroidobacteraceae bacterium]